MRTPCRSCSGVPKLGVPRRARPTPPQTRPRPAPGPPHPAPAPGPPAPPRPDRDASAPRRQRVRPECADVGRGDGEGPRTSWLGSSRRATQAGVARRRAAGGGRGCAACEGRAEGAGPTTGEDAGVGPDFPRPARSLELGGGPRRGAWVSPSPSALEPARLCTCQPTSGPRTYLKSPGRTKPPKPPILPQNHRPGEGGGRLVRERDRGSDGE